MLLDDLLNEFLYDCEIRKLTSKTIKSYKNNCKYLFEYLKQEFQIVDVENVKTTQLKLSYPKKSDSFLVDITPYVIFANNIIAA